MNSLIPVDSLFSGGYFPSPAGLGGGLSGFGSIFDQALGQSTSPAQSAQIAWLQTQYSNQNTLYGMLSDSPSSSFGGSLGDVFGLSGAFSLPSWAYDLQRLLGKDSGVQQAMALGQQASLLAQTAFSHNLSSLGTGFESLV